MKKPSIADLQAEIEALKKKVAELEARPPLVIHNHPPVSVPMPTIAPYVAPTWPQPYWRPGEVYCVQSSQTDLSTN